MASRDYYRSLSRRLSRVMDDIGVNEEDVMSMRKSGLIIENLETVKNQLSQNNLILYVFGSQTEGTTTDGLESDVDVVYTDEGLFNLVQHLDDWVPGKTNLLMIPNERFPGYCKLQLLKSDGPYPEDALPSDGYTLDEAGRVLLIHSFDNGRERRGPAVFISGDSRSADIVGAIRCKTWPNGYKMLSRRHPTKGTWPTPEMISYIENSGCFVVQVAHCLDEKKSESWRISTSLAERCMMFSLNITQIRCYTLIKMTVKTFIDPVVKDVISSYICKNVLFHCVENTKPEFWQESNLLRCVNQILLNLLRAVLCMNCPIYFNESINLLFGKLNKDNQVVLIGIIWKVLISEGGFLREIRFDNMNELIHNDHEINYQRNKDCSPAEKCKDNRTLRNKKMVFRCLASVVQRLVLEGTLSQRDLMSLQNTLLSFALQGPLQYVSTTLLFPFLCSHLATLKAGEHILRGEMLSNRTSLLFDLSLDSDATSSRLRCASYLYCTGQFGRTMMSLLETIPRCADFCIGICTCDIRQYLIQYIDIGSSLSVKYLSPSCVSMCVVFFQAERRCCPKELQYEMYRSTEEERLQRDENGNDDWMDTACINSISYFGFLFYMTSRHMGLRDMSEALDILEYSTKQNMAHKETAFNLLGQCYEYENRLDEAFACYCRSLRVRPTNNAARWHVVLLLNTVYQKEYGI